MRLAVARKIALATAGATGGRACRRCQSDGVSSPAARSLSAVAIAVEIGLYDRWTVHAPQNPRPQPNFVPRMSSVSRSTQSSGVSGATSTVRVLPLTDSVNEDMNFTLRLLWKVATRTTVKVLQTRPCSGT